MKLTFQTVVLMHEDYASWSKLRALQKEFKGQATVEFGEPGFVFTFKESLHDIPLFQKRIARVYSDLNYCCVCCKSPCDCQLETY